MEKSDGESDGDGEYKENATMILPSTKNELVAQMANNARSPDGKLDISSFGLGKTEVFTPSKNLFNQTRTRTKRKIGPLAAGPSDFDTPT